LNELEELRGKLAMPLDRSQCSLSQLLAPFVLILTTPVLNSSKPSSLNTGLATLLAKQHQQSLQTARGNIVI
jgi:hypothetical protein